MFALHTVSDHRHNLDKSLVIDPERSLHHADLGESLCLCVAVEDQDPLSLNDDYNKNKLKKHISNVLYRYDMCSVYTDGHVS